MSINKRIQTIIDVQFGSNKKAFAATVGISPTVVQNLVGKRLGKPSYDVVEKICANANISADWLFTGEGHMTKDKYEDLSNIKITQLHNPKYAEKKEDRQEIPLYNFEATAGLKEILDDPEEYIVDTIRIPDMPKCDGAIKIKGDSMLPKLEPGDTIMYKEMPLSLQDLIYGAIYLISYEIDGEYYVVVKYIKKSEKGEPFIRLVSANKEYAPIDIEFGKINALALVKGSINITSMN